MFYNSGKLQIMKNYKVQKQMVQSSALIKAQAALKQEKFLSQQSNSGRIKFFRFVGEKDKKIKRRPDSILQKLKMYSPISFEHVSNFLNIMSINQRAVKDKTYEESYFCSIFYIKSIEKVQVRKNALILYLKNLSDYDQQSEKNKIQYLIQRYKSFGDLEFYQLALQIQSCYKKYSLTDFSSKLSKCFDSEPLSRFIETMHHRVYSCKVYPNKMVISRALLELLGQDMQSFALGLCKYKTPMHEIISADQYTPVINKSIQSVSLLCDFLQQTIDLEILQQRSRLEFYDYLCTKTDKQIYCKMKIYMPTPLMHCFQAVQVKSQCQENSILRRRDYKKRKLIEDQAQELRFRQTQSLKYLIQVQDNMLLKNKGKVAGHANRDQRRQD